MALLRHGTSVAHLGNVSSFASVEKTLEKATSLLLANDRLKKLLYYTDKNALGLPNLTEEQSLTLIGNAIKIIPKVPIEKDVTPQVVMTLDNFIPEEGQTVFREVTLSIDILCSYNYWQLTDFKLRPYAIAGEIDGMINNSFASGGLANFVGAKQLVLNEYLGGCTLYYVLTTLQDDLSYSSR